MQRGRQPCVQVALGTGQQTRTEALVGRGSSRPWGWRREGWEGFLGLVGAQLLLFLFLEPPHLPLHPPAPIFWGWWTFPLWAGHLSSWRFPWDTTSPLAVLPSFLSSLPLSLASYFTPCLFTVVLASFSLSSPPYKRGAIVAVVFLRTHGLQHARLPWRVIMVWLITALMSFPHCAVTIVCSVLTATRERSLYANPCMRCILATITPQLTGQQFEVYWS